MEIAEFNKYLFVMPLDHPFKLTADYQNQTAQILSCSYNFKILAYQNFAPQARPWELLSKKSRQQLLSRSYGQNILLVTPIHFLPFERYKLVYELNKKISFLFWWIFALIYFSKNLTVLWIFHPRYYWIMNLLRNFFEKTIVIYDCLDYLSSINHKEENLLRKGECELFKKSNLTVMNSQFLADHHTNIKNPIVSPSGFVLPTKKLDLGKMRVKNSSKTPIIGFAGSINYRVDYDLMYKVAKNLTQYTFVFHGPFYSGEEDVILNTSKRRRHLFKLKNVIHKDFISRHNLYKEMQKWDVAIIPYNLNVPLNYYCKPLKLYEYFYFGLPVVSTPIPSIKMYESIIHFAKDSKSWEMAIKQSLAKKDSFKLLQFKQNEALNNSWEKKIGFILDRC